ncbi:unnamed protein product [Cylicostephanus goldi]|uniref:Uncharacterized protein n=1 Tax=Cylicostephanus goldi TaxID=71465 RepID=A0A3P6S3D3_CYLGO|nr:unnamed protein product [Cylicostephanus goldi]
MLHVTEDDKVKVVQTMHYENVLQNIRAHYKLAHYSKRNEKNLLRMTVTIALITSNTILMFTIPDMILLKYPDYNSNILYIMNLNKGVINIIIFVVTQRSFRQVILGRSATSMNVTSIRIVGKQRHSFEVVNGSSGKSTKVTAVKVGL